MLMSHSLNEIIKITLDEKVKIVTFGGGNPGIYMSAFKEAGLTVIPVVASVAIAR